MLNTDHLIRKDNAGYILPSLRKAQPKAHKGRVFFEAIEFYKNNLNRLKKSKKMIQAKSKPSLPTKKTLNLVKLTLSVSPPSSIKNQSGATSVVCNKITYSKVKSENSLKLGVLDKGILAKKINIQVNPKRVGSTTARISRNDYVKQKINIDQGISEKKSLRKSILLIKEAFVDVSCESSIDIKLDSVFKAI